jgi:dTMP kinase
MKRGLFITFEGGEGAGKSIQVEILVSHLHESGIPVVVTREPGGTRIGEQIRAITHNRDNVDLDPVAEAYLMAAARAQHVRQIIDPSLSNGKVVICDRFLDSSLAYQGFGRQLGLEKVENLNSLAVNHCRPDLTLLLEVSPEIGMKRRGKGDKAIDRLDLQQKDFYERIESGYRELTRREPNRFVIIDATKSIEVVGTKIWKVVKTALDKHYVKTKTS